jgi:hypothetical protein
MFYERRLGGKVGLLVGTSQPNNEALIHGLPYC